MTERRDLLRSGLALPAAAAAAAAAATLALPAAVTEAQAQATGGGGVVEAIKQRGALLVGLATFVPWAMRAKDGSLIGFEVDVATKLAEDMGVKPELIPTAWDGIIPALLAGKFDVIIGGMSITPSRNLSVNFTSVYAHSGLQLAASKSAAPSLASYEDLNRPDVTIAIRRGVAPATAFLAKAMPLATVRQFDDDSQAFQEVINGNAQAAISSSPKPEFQVLQYPDQLYMPFKDKLVQNSEAFAVKKGDPDALNFFSNWILFRSQDGWLAERHAYWFETQDWRDKVEKL